MNAATRVPGEDLSWAAPITALAIGCACAATTVALVLASTGTKAHAEPAALAAESAWLSPRSSLPEVASTAAPLPSPALPSAAPVAAVCAPVSVEFEYARESVPSGAAPKLQRLARWLVAHPNTSVLLEGHADASGREDENLALSKHRASNVAVALAVQGVERSRITARGLGAYQPEEGVPENAAVNRRVVAVIKGTNECPKLMEGIGQ